MVIMIPTTSLSCITLSFPVCVDEVEAWERLEDHRTQANMRKDCAVHHCMGRMGMARPPCGLNLDQSHFAEGQLTSRGKLICNALSLFAALSSFSSPCLIFVSHCSYLRNSVSPLALFLSYQHLRVLPLLLLSSSNSATRISLTLGILMSSCWLTVIWANLLQPSWQSIWHWRCLHKPLNGMRGTRPRCTYAGVHWQPSCEVLTRGGRGLETGHAAYLIFSSTFLPTWSFLPRSWVGDPMVSRKLLPSPISF